MLSKLYSESQYLPFTKKNRYREGLAKRFHNVTYKFTQQNASKPETLLRILRSFRIKILHEYCNAIQRDIYADSIKIQALQMANELRRKAMLFPQDKQQLFEIRITQEEIENLSFEEKNAVLKHQAKDELIPMGLENVLTGKQVKTLFFVPSTSEILKLDRTPVDEETALKSAFMQKLVLDHETIDLEVKSLCLGQSRFDNEAGRYKPIKTMKQQVRKVNFREAAEYEQDSLFVLVYLN